jgi:hypothetical protein
MFRHPRSGLARRVAALAMLLAAAASPGCAGPAGPKYATPDMPAGELATLKCDWRYDVIEIDGAEVGQAPVKFFFANGNIVKVQPGNRTVAVSFSDGNQYNAWRFGYVFQPGHVYKIGAPGGFAEGVRVTDKNTTTSTVIH